MELYVKNTAISFINQSCAISCTHFNNSTLYEIDEALICGDIGISLFPRETGAWILPKAAILHILPQKQGLGLSSDHSDFFIDWGNGRYELIPQFSFFSFPSDTQRFIRSMQFEDKDTVSTLNLFFDNGIRLETISNGIERSYFLGYGSDAGMQALDIGSEKLLIVIITNYSSSIYSAANSCSKKRLIVLNGSFEEVFYIDADSFKIKDGMIYSYEYLGTVLNHEIKRKYRTDGGYYANKSKSHSAKEYLVSESIGFYTAKAKKPDTAAEIAVAMLESLLLGREYECLGFLSPELKADISFEILGDFFGDFDEACSAPWNDGKSSSPEIGLISGNKATLFRFSVKNDLISEVIEI